MFGTFEVEVDECGFSVVGIEVVPVDLGLEDDLFRLVVFDQFDD